MKIALVVKEWRNSNLEVVRRDDVSDGAFETGSMFVGSIFLDEPDEEALKRAIEEGYYPVVLVNKQ